MKAIQICVVYTFLTALILHSCIEPVNSCLSGCTCTTVPASEADSGEDGEEEIDEDEIALPSAPRGRKVNCSNNPYRFSSMEDVNRAIKIPLDTIYL